MYKDDSESHRASPTRRADFSIFFVLPVVFCPPFSISYIEHPGMRR